MKKKMKQRAVLGSKQWIMIRFFVCLICGILCITQQGVAQSILKDNLIKGEDLEYDLYYNWNFVWIKGGRLTLKSEMVDYQDGKAFMCTMSAATRNLPDKIYKVRDTLISYLDTNTLRPLSFWKAANEGKHSSIEGGTFTYRNGEVDVYAFKHKKGRDIEEVETTVSGDCTDAVGVIYMIRGLEKEKIESGDDIPLMVFSGKKKYDMSLRYKGNERIEAQDKKKYECMKFVLYIQNKEAFEEEESMRFWLTDDDDRIPIQIETKIKVGSLRGVYKKGK